MKICREIDATDQRRPSQLNLARIRGTINDNRPDVAAVLLSMHQLRNDGEYDELVFEGMQAEDRSHRLGQERPVTIYRLVTLNTVTSCKPSTVLMLDALMRPVVSCACQSFALLQHA